MLWKAKEEALVVPCQGQCADALEAPSGQLDRLTTGEDGFDNVGS